MAGDVRRVVRLVEWLEVHAWLRENTMPIKTPTASSYGMKRVAERGVGENVSNGAFIPGTGSSTPMYRTRCSV